MMSRSHKLPIIVPVVNERDKRGEKRDIAAEKADITEHKKMLKFNPSQRPTFEEIEEDIDLKLYFNKIFQIEEFFD